MTATLRLVPELPDPTYPQLRLQRVRPREPGLPPPSSDHAPAEVALGGEFSAFFANSHGHLLTRSDLHAATDSTVLSAWHRSATELINAHTQGGRTTFYIRSAAVRCEGAIGGLEISTTYAPATSWLAHPATAQLLDRHLHDVWELSPGIDIVYAAPHTEMLLACPLTSIGCAAALAGWLRSVADPESVAVISSTLLTLRGGYPAPVAGLPLPPAPASGTVVSLDSYRTRAPELIAVGQ